MTSSRTPRFEALSTPVIRKIALTLVAGGATYVVTNLTNQPQSTILTLSILIGGVTLLAQFLSSFEARQRHVEERLASLESQQVDGLREMKELVTAEVSRINQATRLYDEISRSATPAFSADRLAAVAMGFASMKRSLAFEVAQAEVDSALRFAERLAKDEEVSYEGEDRDWLWALTRNAKISIDATSRASEAVNGSFVDEAFWESEVGVRYLEWQRQAIERGVSVRRIFVVDVGSTANNAEFRKMVREQSDAGIEARILDASTVTPARRLLIPDLVIFDREVSYELTHGSKFGEDAVPHFLYTRLIFDAEAVSRRVRSFEEFWALSSEPPANKNGQSQNASLELPS